MGGYALCIPSQSRRGPGGHAVEALIAFTSPDAQKAVCPERQPAPRLAVQVEGGEPLKCPAQTCRLIIRDGRGVSTMYMYKKSPGRYEGWGELWGAPATNRIKIFHQISPRSISHVRQSNTCNNDMVRKRENSPSAPERPTALGRIQARGTRKTS